MPSIFISVPSVEDPEIKKTITDAIENSSGANSINIGCAHSILFKSKKIINDIENNFKDIPNVKNIYLNSKTSVGVGHGRKAAASLYNNEDYFLQIDGHTLFKKNWDQILIDSLIEAKNFLNYEKIILTSYLPRYGYKKKDYRDFIIDSHPLYPFYVHCDKTSNKYDEKYYEFWSEDSKVSSIYEKIPKWKTPGGARHYTDIKRKYELSTKINANFIFATKDFMEIYNKLFPWDFLFFEEEFIMSIELIDSMYVPVYPNFSIPLGHLYSDDFNKFYPGRDPLVVTNKRAEEIKDNIDKYFNQNSRKIINYCNYSGLKYPELKTFSYNYIPRIEDVWWN